MNTDKIIATGAGGLFIIAVLASITGLDLNTLSLLAIGDLFLEILEWAFLLSSKLLLVPVTLITGYILYKSILSPRLIPVLNLMGGPLIFISAVLMLFGLFLELSIWGLIFVIPVFAYELFLAIWQIMKGFNSTSVGTQMF